VETGDLLNKPGGLAECLLKLRKTAKLTQVALAEAAGWPSSKVSKIETGQQFPSGDDITAWCAACGQPEAAGELRDLLETARSSRRQYRLRGSQAAIQAELDRLVRSARHVRNFEPIVIPGLLQTPDYARYRALEGVRVHGFREEDVEATVAARMRRQEVLYGAGRQFDFVITEAALRFLLCPPGVMLGQLDRLMSVPGLAGVTLSIVPFGTVLEVAPMHGFMLLDDAAYVEEHSGDRELAGREAETFKAIGEALLGEAVTGNEARDLIVSAAAFLRG